jgi:hypothetical protein
LQEQKAFQQEIFGAFNPLSVEEYMSIYRTTGIDVDGRRDLLQFEVLHSIEDSIKRFVSFAKTIPGFNQLSINDQTGLVKGEIPLAFILFDNIWLHF